jgi:hypothetical protein
MTCSEIHFQMLPPEELKEAARPVSQASEADNGQSFCDDGHQ